ncbi:hypothetical protein [Ruminococcus bicirculans (ex Wegman et al. 2014)]|uniref:hypothetical protein n=1 Tax=Ruminococcus bicirculans (ex Wegman et al. 2014) TaxID=1160721 RepID=UPI00242E3A0D|nr:hypothetical protein [Ruminococcus bicirculans (ex Wegman et al. 2014)]
MKQLMIIYEPDYNSLLELNKLKFETINDYIAFLTNNADSFHIVMPFFISNHSNEKEFEDFLQSDAFNNAVTKANDNSADIAPEKELALQSDVNENNSEKDEKTMTTNQNENNMNMLFYLGSIDNDYATLIINPMAKLENDKLIEVDLPTIKIASNFENRFTTSDAQKCYICYIDTENDIYSVEKNGKNQAQINAKKITPKDPSLEKIYEVIDISLTNTNMDQFRRKKPYYLSSYDTPVTDRIFIENGEYLYGPFIWNDLNRSSDKIEIIPEVKDINNQYSIYRLKKSKVNNYVSEFQLTHSFTDSRSSKFICFDIESMTTIIESYDFIDDESLKSIFAQKMSSEQIEKSMRQSIQSKIKNMDTSLFTDERKNRMLQMSIDTFNNDDFISDFVKKALSNEDFWSEETDGVTKKIRTNLLGYINNNAEEKERFLKIEETKEQKEEELRAQNEQLEQLKNDKNVLLKEIEELKKNKENIEQKKVTTEMVQEKEKLISEIHELEEKLNLGNEIKDWEERRRNAEVDFLADEKSNNKTIANLTNKINDLNKQKEDINGTIDELTKNGQKAIIEAYNNVAFNDIFSDMIVNCANNYAKSTTHGNSLKSPGTDIAREFSSAEECIKSIQEELKRYDHNEIANILICLSQGFLTVFAGKPGTGKTSFCERFAKVCGLDTSADNSEHTRFIELSVEKGWASKRDFIGYYNPINKSFDQTNGLVYPALKLLSQEQQNGISDYPFFIMLDEANLSPMEYYWSEFINVCDFDNNRAIDLGDSESCCIPNTLRFMATINYDSTTENLSPRLLDRAWVIDLDNEIDYNELYDDNIENASKMLSFAVMNEYFGANLSFDKQMDSQISKVVTSETMAKLDKIYDICKPYLSISPRVRKSILKYCYIANEKKLFDSNNINIALDYAISQRVLPLINGYGTGDNRYKTEFLDKLMETCNSYSLDKCCKILRQIISSGNNNMNYYNYFNR